MSLAFAVQIKGLGPRLCFGYKQNAFLRASTLVKTHAGADSRQVAEESFDHVEPTAAGGREVEMKALVRTAQRRTAGVVVHSCRRSGGAVCRRAFGDR